MTARHPTRRTVLLGVAGGAIGLAVAASATAPWQSRNAEAQVDPSESATGIAPVDGDPALAEADSALAEGGVGAVPSDTTFVTSATPVVTPEASVPSPTWEPTEAGMSTSLGGSDIAVASVGGSYQVDGPKRKADKIKGEKKRP